MRAKNEGPEPTRAAGRVVADIARAARASLRQQKLPVSPNVDQLAACRRGKASARQLMLLTDALCDAYGEQGAVLHFAEMGARLVSARKAS